jgi:3-isopropylmalate/(R)-2-methylmalate dehydratase small subunit
MGLAKITQMAGRGVYVSGSDIDTDRIIPARFMKCVTFDGLGEYAFYDVRYDKDGNKTGHPLDDTRFAGATVLLSGSNFGCGSSREHAPQALYRFGFRAVVAESFAEIFFGNCTTLGIPCLCASSEEIQWIAAEVEKNPQAEINLDILARTIEVAGRKIKAQLPETAHDALTKGKWDAIADLLESKDRVQAKMVEMGWVK